MENNVQKMREIIKGFADAFCGDGIVYGSEVDDLLQQARSVLALPLRQCDMGTEDSITQFQEYCDSHDCETCEYLRFKDRGERYACAIAWMEANAERGGLCHEG